MPDEFKALADKADAINYLEMYEKWSQRSDQGFFGE